MVSAITSQTAAINSAIGLSPILGNAVAEVRGAGLGYADEDALRLHGIRIPLLHGPLGRTALAERQVGIYAPAVAHEQLPRR